MSFYLSDAVLQRHWKTEQLTEEMRQGLIDGGRAVREADRAFAESVRKRYVPDCLTILFMRKDMIQS